MPGDSIGTRVDLPGSRDQCCRRSAAKGVTAIKLDGKDRVLGFTLAGKKREGLTVRTTRGGIQIVRVTKYPVSSRGGKGHGILQRGSLDAVLHDDAEPVPPMEEVEQ